MQKTEVLQFGQHQIAIRRRRHKRSYDICLQVNGLIWVTVPMATSLARIREFVLSNLDWVETHSRHYQDLRATHPRKSYREGELFPFLGRAVKLEYSCVTGERVEVGQSEGVLSVGLPEKSWRGFERAKAHPEVQPAVTEFYKREGCGLLSERVVHYSRKMDVQPRKVVFRSHKSRWGSCSASGNVSLNWRLVIAPLEVLDYVVVHELAHLSHYNHSDEFWSLVARHSREYVRHQDWLLANQFAGDFLGPRSELHDL